MRNDARALPHILLFALLCSPAAGAQTEAPRWKALGPPGEEVNAIAVDPRNSKTVFAGTRVGLYKSVDGAATWSLSSKGLDDTAILALLFDPANSKTLYAAGWSGGLWKSFDGGASWKSMTPRDGRFRFAERVPMRSVALDPSNSKNLVFGSLFKSADGGVTWTEIDPPAYPSGARDVNALAFDPKNGRVIWSADTGSLKRSSDFGMTWKVVDIGVPEPAQVCAVAVHARNSNIVFAGTRHSGLFRTSDGGKTWQKSETGLQQNADIRAIAPDPADAKRLFVAATLKQPEHAMSVFSSADGGESFEDVGADLPWEPIETLALDPNDSKTLYAGTGFSGVFVTHDAGASWSEANRGLPLGSRTVNALAAAGGALYAATFGAIHRSDDGGATWQRLKSGFEKGVPIDRLVATNSQPPFVVAGGKDVTVRRSPDGGATWDKPNREYGLRCLAADPKDTGTVYACGEAGGVYRLTSGGSSKRYGDEELTSTLDAIAVDPSNGETMLVSDSGTGLRRSTNGGKKWKEFNKGVTKVKSSMMNFGEYRVFFALSWLAAEPRTIYGVTDREGVWVSTDAGEKWTAAGLTDQVLTAFARDPGNPKRLAAGTEEKGVFLSSDGGTSWSSIGAGLPENDRKVKLRVKGIAFGAGSPSHLYVALKDGGVFCAY